DLISKHNKEGIFLHASSSCITLLGYTPDELIGKSIFHFLHPEDVPKIQNALLKIWNNHKVQVATFRFRNKKNKYNWFETTGKSVKHPETNEIIEIQVSSRDITSRKKAEQELAKERQYLLAVLENVNDAIVACDENGAISFFNKTARELHGLPEKPIYAEEWALYYDLYNADGKTLMQKEDIPLFRAFRGEHVENVEMVVAPQNGKKKTLLATAKQIYTSENQLWGAVVAMHDITEKKEWEEKLVKKEALLIESQSMAHLGSWEWNLDTDRMIWSKELKNIFQFNPDSEEAIVIDKPYLDFVHPENLIEIKECLAKVIEEKEAFTLEHKIVLKDKSIRWVLSKGKYVKDENENIISGILLDITELKTAELKAKEDRRLIHNIANASPDIIYVHDLISDKAIYISRDLAKSLGYGQEDVLFWKQNMLQILVHPDDKEIKDVFERKILTLKDQELLEARYRLKDVNNFYRWFLFRSTIFKRNKSGEPIQVLGVIQEITDKIKAENAVKYREAQLLEAQRLAKAGSFIYDFKRNLLSWSPEMYRIFGHQPTMIPISIKTFEDSLHPDDKETVKDSITNSIENLKFLDLEHRIILPNGAIRYISTRGRVLLNKKGEPSKILGSTMDVTERKQSEDELQRKNNTILNAYQKLESAQKDLHRINSRLEEMVKDRTRQLSQTNKELKEKNKELLVINSDLDNFIYTASHDLKSPISNMEGLINLLNAEMKGKFNNTEADIMRMIALSINKFKQTIQDLTEITKVQKEVNENSEVISFSDILEDVKSDINSMILESGAKFISDFKIKEVPYAVKNLRSIIYNLLTNAIKYRSPERPLVIELKTEKEGDFVAFTMTDNGLGLSPEQKGKMFNMFRRFHTHVDGTGIGLYIVKRIIENNGGKIEVESEIGKGSSFKVFFNVKELFIYEKI
ncbi:MAG: PAS domain-containing protein, partial [Bacteroidota bacterium]|nr:PAS domain-containing protein [Bacteroidota bacterium]